MPIESLYEDLVMILHTFRNLDNEVCKMPMINSDAFCFSFPLEISCSLAHAQSGGQFSAPQFVFISSMVSALYYKC